MEGKNLSIAVINIIKELSAIDTVNEDDTLADLNLDSLSMVMLLVNLEDFFDIEFDESDLNPYDLETVGSVFNLVNKYV